MIKNPCTCQGCDRCEPARGQCVREAAEGPDRKCQPCVADAASKAQPQMTSLPPKKAPESHRITLETGALTMAGISAAVIWSQLYHHEKLLDRARASLDADNNPDMAVVLAQTACEVGTEQVMTILLEKKGMAIITEPLLSTFRPYNILNNEHLRDIYNALSGQLIQTEPFWQKLHDHNKRRNKIVHRGVSCSTSEAGESLDAVLKYFEHLNKTVNAL